MFKNQTILVTGGGSGIGLALASRLLSAGNTVIVCGRRTSVLDSVKKKFPAIHTHVCDISTSTGRVELFDWAIGAFPKLSVLVNNAGVQRHVKLTSDTYDSSEIAINLEAPIHLSMLFAQHLSGQKDSCIINVTSGLAFSPLASVPVYCATKAALHSFTLSLRQQMPFKVVEILPPAVNTDLGGVGLHNFGEPLDKFADAVFERLLAGELEIAHGFAEEASKAGPEKLGEIFKRMNSR